MAAMSVIGIDFGNDSCYVAVARAGGIETIANDYSLRGTPSCVAFSGKSRILGVGAKNQMVTNMKNTVYGFKRLLGRKYNDPQVQRELESVSYKTCQQPDGSIGIRVQYLGEEHVFSPVQITAMLFTKLKDISETVLQTVVNDCVISVPSYFTQNERAALLDAARIAGLNVLRLFNETTATALCYGIYKQDLPDNSATYRNVVFVDVGYASLQVSICSFQAGKLKVLATAADGNLGGRDIDTILADHFCKDFQTRYKIDARTNSRAYLRLLAEVEKLKKQMSANSTTLPLNIECFMEEKDVHGEMNRVDMEAMCSHLFKRVEATLRRCLADSQLRTREIHSVEVTGGSSRVPAIKKLVEEVFEKPLSTTLNQDESVSRGCAVQCAMLSPAVRIREFSITDVQPYPIKFIREMSPSNIREYVAFEYNHVIPYAMNWRVRASNPFTMTACYVTPPATYPDTHIATYQIDNVKPTAEGDPCLVKINIRLTLDGMVTIASASHLNKGELERVEEETQRQTNCVEGNGQQDKKDKTDQEAEGVEPLASEVMADKKRRDRGADDARKGGRAGSATSYSSRILAWLNLCEDPFDRRKWLPVRLIDRSVEGRVGGLAQHDLEIAIEKEGKMIAGDKQEKERIDVRNALEEYVYDLRGKISDEDQLATFVTESDRETLSRILDDTENWLYEEGEECNRQVYCDRLTSLKGQGEPIKERKLEFEGRTQALNDLSSALQISKKSYEQIKSAYGKDDRYAHITEEELKQVGKTIQEKWTWFDDAHVVFASTPRTQLPSITVAQIRSAKQALDSSVTPILNKPKAKVEQPPKLDEKSKDKSSEEQKAHQANSQGGDAHKQNNQQSAKEDKMDVE